MTNRKELIKDLIKELVEIFPIKLLQLESEIKCHISKNLNELKELTKDLKSEVNILHRFIRILFIICLLLAIITFVK